MGTFQGLPKWAQGVLAVAGLGLSTIIGWTIYNKVSAIATTKKARKEIGDIEDEIKELKKEGNIVPTISKAQLAIMAGQLEQAFQEAGTDEDQIKRIFGQIKNDADVLILIKTYGIRSIKNPIAWQAPLKGTLGQALSDELSADEIEEYINSVFVKKNIKYRF